jgi:hypothetical protein
MKSFLYSFLVWIFYLTGATISLAQSETIILADSSITGMFPQLAYPQDAALVLNECIGETYHYFKPAEDWRRTNTTGDSSVQWYKNPFVDEGRFAAQLDGPKPAFYFRKGKPYNGVIQDTLEVSGHRSYRYHYEHSNENHYIFQVNCINGLVEGIGTLHSLKTGELVSSAEFKAGKLSAIIAQTQKERNKP